ncbi:MAG: M48 family metalloprotease [Nocardioides sp.]
MTDRALEHLVAHELAHVAYLRSPVGRVRQALIGAVIVLMGLALTLAAGLNLASMIRRGSPWPEGVGFGLVLAGVLGLAWLVFLRHQEVKADVFAIRLVPDLDAAAQLFRHEAGAEALRRRRHPLVGMLAMHPEPRLRLASMADALARRPAGTD